MTVALYSAVVLALLTMAVVVFVPLQRWESVTTDSTGRITTSSGRNSLIESEGAGVLVAAAIPSAIAALPLLAGRRAGARTFGRVLTASTVVLALFVFLAGFSIGLFYVPTLVALVMARSPSR